MCCHRQADGALLLDDNNQIRYVLLTFVPTKVLYRNQSSQLLAVAQSAERTSKGREKFLAVTSVRQNADIINHCLGIMKKLLADRASLEMINLCQFLICWKLQTFQRWQSSGQGSRRSSSLCRSTSWWGSGTLGPLCRRQSPGARTRKPKTSRRRPRHRSSPTWSEISIVCLGLCCLCEILILEITEM